MTVNKLWDKGVNVDKRIEAFTIGMDRNLDLKLASFDVLGSLAHVKMLESAGLLTREELTLLTAELRQLHKKATAEDFEIEDGVEDVHSQIEMLLTRKLGDVGKKIHSGRSRNDQVLLDLKLFARDEIKAVTQKVQVLFDAFLRKSEKHRDVLLPGYTHTQVAMPSSFGLWFGAYAESLIDDLCLLEASYAIVNQNPLGSGAGYGSSFPLNRQMTTDLLGFDHMNYNVVYAQMGRGKMERSVAFALASLASTIAKFSADACLYMSQDFGFITLPDHLTTGSSIMPHKKNPDVFELLRGHGNKIMALPGELMLTTANLTSGYHRDLQVLKESFIPVFDTVKELLDICAYMVEQLVVKENILAADKYRYLFSVEAVNREVLQGVPFRDAYQKIGRMIEEGTFQPEKTVRHTHEGSIGNLCNDRIAEKMAMVAGKFNFQKVDQAVRQLLED